MNIQPLSIPDLLLIQPKRFADSRGYFFESYHFQKYTAAGIPDVFVQDNISGSRQGVLRGLHYQVGVAVQGKLVQALSGAVFDVAVDLRKRSPTFGHWAGCVLQAEERTQLWVPPGFGHGFYVLSEWADVHYKVTNFYAPEAERTILWNDPVLEIEWPLLGGLPVEISPKDAAGASFRDAEVFA